MAQFSLFFSCHVLCLLVLDAQYWRTVICAFYCQSLCRCLRLVNRGLGAFVMASDEARYYGEVVLVLGTLRPSRDVPHVNSNFDNSKTSGSYFQRSMW